MSAVVLLQCHWCGSPSLRRGCLGQSQGDKMGDLALVAPTANMSRVAFSFARGGKASVLFKQVVFSSPTFAMLGCSRGGKNLTRTQEHGWVIQSFCCCLSWDTWDIWAGDMLVGIPLCLDTPTATHQTRHHLYKALDVWQALLSLTPCRLKLMVSTYFNTLSISSLFQKGLGDMGQPEHTQIIAL